MGVSRLDFVRRGPSLSGWRLALLAAGVLTLLPAALHWLTQAQGAHQLEQQLARLERRPPARAPLGATQQRDQDMQLKAVGDAVRQLNLPVTRLIKTVQPPRDARVALLGLDLNGQPGQDGPSDGNGNGAGGLKIAAEGETAQDMIDYLAFLNQQPLFKTVYLVKHEMRANAPNHPYRFQLEAQWRQ
ncbi:MAG: hypothetical protein V4754_16710 [Pseudomonadota bacterium]